MGCTRANNDGNGECREADKSGSVLARNPHFGHGACVTYRETPHPSSVSPMAIYIPIEHFGHGACAFYSRRHPRVQSMGQPADTMSARAYHPPSDNDRVSRALSALHHGLRPRSNGRAGTWGKPEVVALPYWACACRSQAAHPECSPRRPPTPGASMLSTSPRTTTVFHRLSPHRAGKQMARTDLGGTGTETCGYA